MAIVDDYEDGQGRLSNCVWVMRMKGHGNNINDVMTVKLFILFGISIFVLCLFMSAVFCFDLFMNTILGLIKVIIVYFALRIMHFYAFMHFLSQIPRYHQTLI